MRIYKKFSFLIIIALFGLSYLSIGNSYEDTEFLFYMTDISYEVEMNIGDNLTWSFETYGEEFWVSIVIGIIYHVSNGQTSDSGVWYAPDTDTFNIVFINMDLLLLRNGYIDIYFEVNVEPSSQPDSISGFNPLVVIGVVGFISVISAILIKKRICGM